MDCELSIIRQYKNPQVLHYFCHHHPAFSLQEGEQLFEDLLSWMWLSQQRKTQAKTTRLFGPLLPLDALWHAFILHTRDYVDFSMRYFGTYFHHEVEPLGREHVMQEAELTDFLHDCLSYLGSAWVERRFAEAFR
ncbi:MAG: hypothetical protein JJT82_06005 [Legionellaceae bacterium]|nr:hypothetical protein [Legionellaceae bacterium]